MIIGIDASRANVQQKTGTEWYAYYLIQEFKKIADPRDQFVLYSKEALAGELADLPPNFTNKVLAWPPGFLWTQFRLAWEMLLHAPEVLFVPAHTIPLIHPKNTVTTLHDVGFEFSSSLYSQKQIGPPGVFLKKILWITLKILTFGHYGNTELDYHRWAVRFALKHAKKIITISNFSKNEIIRYFKPLTNRIVVIYHGLGPSYRLITDRDIVREKISSLGINKPYFLYIGRLEEKKNTANLINAFGIYKKICRDDRQLVLVGNPGYGYDKIIASIKKQDLETNVKLTGWLPADTLPYLMNGAEAFVFPSAYEGFGLPLIEAMACGTPVITSNFGSMKELGNQVAMLVDPNNPSDIATAMKRIINDNQLRNQAINKGLERASLFTWSNTAHRTLELLVNP